MATDVIDITIAEKNESIRIPEDGRLFDSGGRAFSIISWDTTSEVGSCSEIVVKMRRTGKSVAPITKPASAESTVGTIHQMDAQMFRKWMREYADELMKIASGREIV